MIHGDQGFHVKAKAEAGGSFPVYEGFVYFDLCPDSECRVSLREKTAGVDEDTPLPYGKLMGWNTQEIEGIMI